MSLNNLCKAYFCPDESLMLSVLNLAKVTNIQEDTSFLNKPNLFFNKVNMSPYMSKYRYVI